MKTQSHKLFEHKELFYVIEIITSSNKPMMGNCFVYRDGVYKHYPQAFIPHDDDLILYPTNWLLTKPIAEALEQLLNTSGSGVIELPCTESGSIDWERLTE